MITKIQREFIRKVLSGEITKEDYPRYNQIMARIQVQIDKSMENLVWLADNAPHILKDEKAEIDDMELERFRRFKTLSYVMHILNPMTELEEVGLTDILRKLSLLYPKNYFKIVKKKYADSHAE